MKIAIYLDQMSYITFLESLQDMDQQSVLALLKKELDEFSWKKQQDRRPERLHSLLKSIMWWTKYLTQSKIPDRPRPNPIPDSISDEKCYEIEKENAKQSIAYIKTRDEFLEWRADYSRVLYECIIHNLSDDWSTMTNDVFMSELAYNLMLSTAPDDGYPVDDVSVLGVKAILTMMCGNHNFATVVYSQNGSLFFAIYRTLSQPVEYISTLRTLFVIVPRSHENKRKVLLSYPMDIEKRLIPKTPAQVLPNGTQLFTLNSDLFPYPHHIAKVLSGVLALKIGVFPGFPALVRAVDVSNFLRNVFDNYDFEPTWPHGKGGDIRQAVWSCDEKDPVEMIRSLLDWQQTQPPIEWSQLLVTSLLSQYREHTKHGRSPSCRNVNRLCALADLVDGWGGYCQDGSPNGNKISRRCLAMALEFVLAVRQPSRQFEIRGKRNGSLVVVYPDERDIKIVFNLDGSYTMK